MLLTGLSVTRKSALCAFSLVLGLLVAVPPALGQVTISVDAPSSVQLGTGLRYLIQVANTDATPANALVMTDTLPAGVTANSFPSNCAGTTTVICDIGTLPAGQSTTIPIEVVPPAAGTIVNSAIVTGGSIATASTTVITNGVILSVFVNSSNASDVVTSSPAGITCVGAQDLKHRCSAFFQSGSSVVLTASAPNFLGWFVPGGSCPGTGTCTLMMNQQQEVGAGYTSPLAVTSGPSSGVTGVVNVPFDIDTSDAAIGGTPPYTFSFGGTLPPGLTVSGPPVGSSDSTISGIPTTTGTFPITLQVTDSLGAVASNGGTITIITAPNGQEGLLNGPYALLFRGVREANFSERAFVGSLNFDGAGGVSGTIERNCNAGCTLLTLPVSGTYSIGNDNRGLINLNNGTFILAIAVGEVSGGVASRARVIRFDDAAVRGAGELRRQNTAAFTQSSIAGTYVFGMTGEDPAPTLNRVVEVGLVTMDTTLGITAGTADLNDNGSVNPLSFTGSYTTPSATGRTLLTLNLGGVVAVHVLAYVVDANELFLMTFDPGSGTNPYPVLAGTADRQTNPGLFSNTSLAGPDVISLEGLSGGVSTLNSEVFLGILTASAGSVSITFDSDDNRVVQIQNTESGPYTVTSNGRATLTLGTPSPLIAYLSGRDQGYVMATNANPGFGEIALQTGGPFSNTSLGGHYFSGDREPASPSGGPVTSGTGFAEACTITFTNDESHHRGTLDYGQQFSTGYAVSPSGRVTTTFALGNLVSYLISPSHAVSAVVDPQENHPHIVEGFSVFVTPEPRLVSIAVTPATTTLGVGQTQQYIATGTYSDQSTKDLTNQVNWVSSNLGVATISSTGLATTAAVGTANILASLGCLSSAPVALSVPAGSLTVVKNTVGGDGTFSFTGTGTGIPASFQITTSGNTNSYTIPNLTPGSNYSISEQSQTGWDPTSASCTNGNPSAIVIVGGQTTTCTFTNTQRARVRVTKTFNGGSIPSGAAFTFQLRDGASATAAGTILENETFTSSTSGGTILFTALLVPGRQYEMCEQMLPGWLTTLGPPMYSVYNPSGDNSVVCTNFIPTAGQTKQFTIDNQPPPGGIALGIGFWKNWASCAGSSGQQKPTLDQTLASGGIYVGNLFVTTCQTAVKLLNKLTANGTKAASSPAYNLAAQLLAAELNIRAGAGSNACVANDITWANDILNPVTDALHNAGIDFANAFNSNTANPTMTSKEVTDANYLQTQLNNYNNNLSVQCSTTYQF